MQKQIKRIKRKTEERKNIPSLPISIPFQKQEQVFTLLAETFKTMGDFSRIQIIWALAHQEYSVGELGKLFSMSQPAVSHHLQRLRAFHLVKVRRVHRTIFYSLDDKHIKNLLDEGIEHVEELL